MAHKRNVIPALPVSQARQQLSPLLRRLSRNPRMEIPISVRGQVRAYLVSADRLRELEAAARGLARGKAIQNTIEIMGDLEAGSRQAAKELEAWALSLPLKPTS